MGGNRLEEKNKSDGVDFKRDEMIKYFGIIRMAEICWELRGF